MHKPNRNLLEDPGNPINPNIRVLLNFTRSYKIIFSFMLRDYYICAELISDVMVFYDTCDMIA